MSDHFFSFSVPPRSSPEDQQGLHGSVSPDSTHRPGTAGAAPFAFSVPSTGNGEASPDSSRGSRPTTAIATKPPPAGAAAGPSYGSGRFPGVQGEGGFNSGNTRPMTAPGAGWNSSFNHGYDYNTASQGLYGTPVEPQNRPSWAAGTPTQRPPQPPSQHMQSPASAPYSEQSSAYRNRNFSLPETAPGSSGPGHSPTAAPSMYPSPGACALGGGSGAGGTSAAQAGPSYLRPSTHAGTSAPFGDRPGSSYGYSAYGGGSDSRPMTAASTSSAFGYGGSGGPGGVPMYSNGMIPSVLAPPGSMSGGPPVPGMVGAGYVGVTNGIGGEERYTFVALPGAPRKRARRRFDEIERLYDCNYPGCTKAYGTLNHLNAHITMQKHGPKRLPQEFKEIRKEWRARKKAEAEARNSARHRAHPGGASVHHLPPPSSVSSRPSTGNYPVSSLQPHGLPMPAPYFTAIRPQTAPGGGMLPTFATAQQPRDDGPPYPPMGGSYGAAGAGSGGDFAYQRPGSSAGAGSGPWRFGVGVGGSS